MLAQGMQIMKLRYIARIFFIVFLLCQNLSLRGQVFGNYQLWNEVNLRASLSNKVELRVDGRYVSGSNIQQTNILSNKQLLMSRAWLQWKVRPNLKVLALSGIWERFSLNKEQQHFTEYRLGQYLVHQKSWKNLKMQNRIGLEQRFIENEDNAHPQSLRFRYWLMFRVPLERIIKRKDELIFYDEIFIHPDSQNQNVGQNRVAAGYNLYLHQNYKLRLLYFWQIQPKTSQWTYNHVFWTTLNMRIF